jgi:hypothetical protein
MMGKEVQRQRLLTALQPFLPLITDYTSKGKVIPVLSIEHHAMKAYWGVEV